MGHHAQTGAVIGLTSGGVKVGSCPKRCPLNTRWSVAGRLEVRGLLWELQPRNRDVTVSLTQQRLAVTQSGQHVTFYVLKSDTAKHGAKRDRSCTELPNRVCDTATNAGRESWKQSTLRGGQHQRLCWRRRCSTGSCSACITAEVGRRELRAATAQEKTVEQFSVCSGRHR